MKNTMLPQQDVDNMRKVIDALNHYMEEHNKIFLPNLASLKSLPEGKERVHILLYMDMVKDIIRDVKSLETILDCSEEEFINIVTDEGKMSLKEVETTLMMSMLMETIRG